MSVKKKIITGACIALGMAVIALAVFIIKNWNEPRPVHIEPIEMKVGRYYLQRESGPDKTDYIEIFDDNTVQFFGEYWEKKDAETAATRGNSSDPLDFLYTDRQPYTFSPGYQSIALGLKNEEELSWYGIYLGAKVVDEKTFNITREREDDDVIDYNDKYFEDIIIAAYVCEQ